MISRPDLVESQLNVMRDLMDFTDFRFGFEKIGFRGNIHLGDSQVFGLIWV